MPTKRNGNGAATWFPRSRAKFNAVRTQVDGIWFDSKKEAARYGELKLLQDAGKIAGLECHPKYKLEVNGKLICVYKADFWYHDLERGVYVVEDTKGVKTPVYRIKKKLYEALYLVPITET